MNKAIDDATSINELVVCGLCGATHTRKMGRARQEYIIGIVKENQMVMLIVKILFL